MIRGDEKEYGMLKLNLKINKIISLINMFESRVGKIMKELSIKTGMTKEEIEYISDQLYEFNLKTAPLNQDPIVKDIHLALKGDDNIIYGGLIGKIYRFCLFIDILWISEEQRGAGYGGKLLKEAEKIAISEQCKFIHLDTFSFQAPEFYRKNGYCIFGVLDGYPDGIKRYYLKKDLKPSSCK